MKFMIILYIALVLSYYGCDSSPYGNINKPNVLFILVDDLGYSDVGFMGSNYYETPNIDELASRGVVFTHGYSNCSGCSPSRASIMTGLYTCNHGILNWIGEAQGENWRRKNFHTKLLPPTFKVNMSHIDERAILPNVFKYKGYKTFFAGKWHLGYEGYYPNDFGFDINIGGNHYGIPYGGYFSPYKNKQLEDVEIGENLTLRLAKETSDFIKLNQDTSFFAFLSFYAVHGPIETSKERWRKYRNKILTSKHHLDPVGFELADGITPHRKYQDNPIYGGLVESVDDAVGIVMNTLDELELLDNTIIVFTSDNGGVVSGESFSTNLHPLRGGKGMQWEGGIRVPLIIYAPGQMSKERVEVPAMGSDLFPTIMDLADIEIPSTTEIDGISLSPLLKGGSIDNRSLIWHCPHYSHHGGLPTSIIRRGKWKLIHYYEDSRNELYDLSKDISENYDVSYLYPDIVNCLYFELDSTLTSSGTSFPIQDTLFEPNKRSLYENSLIENVMPILEERRKNMLKEDYKPNQNWWGSIN